MHAEKTDPPQSVTPYVGDESHFSRLAAVIPCMLYDYVLKPDGSSQFLYVGPKCREILELSDMICSRMLACSGNLYSQKTWNDLNLRTVLPTGQERPFQQRSVYGHVPVV